jgi:hypothetical protein
MEISKRNKKKLLANKKSFQANGKKYIFDKIKNLLFSRNFC